MSMSDGIAQMHEIEQKFQGIISPRALKCQHHRLPTLRKTRRCFCTGPSPQGLGGGGAARRRARRRALSPFGPRLDP